MALQSTWRLTHPSPTATRSAGASHLPISQKTQTALTWLASFLSWLHAGHFTDEANIDADPEMVKGESTDCQWSETKLGAPQGAVAPPLPAKVHLHYVLDLWFEVWRKVDEPSRKNVRKREVDPSVLRRKLCSITAPSRSRFRTKPAEIKEFTKMRAAPNLSQYLTVAAQQECLTELPTYDSTHSRGWTWLTRPARRRGREDRPRR